MLLFGALIVVAVTVDNADGLVEEPRTTEELLRDSTAVKKKYIHFS